MKPMTKIIIHSVIVLLMDGIIVKISYVHVYRHKKTCVYTVHMNYEFDLKFIKNIYYNNNHTDFNVNVSMGEI